MVPSGCLLIFLPKLCLRFQLSGILLIFFLFETSCNVFCSSDLSGVVIAMLMVQRETTIMVFDFVIPLMLDEVFEENFV